MCRAAFLLPLLVLMSACARQEPAPPAPPVRPDWVVRSQVIFLAADGKTPAPVPLMKNLRLWVPYVVGDFYGAPNASGIVTAQLKPDLSFSIDLNETIGKLEKSLVPTEFSQKWLSIEPVSARVARVSPFVLPEEGIVPVGMCQWLDADTGGKLMLIYIDRPARIRGEIVHEGRSLRFDIDAAQSGYLWITQPDGSGEFRGTPRPARLVLAVMPDA